MLAKKRKKDRARTSRGVLTKLDEDFSKVIGVARPVVKANVANCFGISLVSIFEAILLYIAIGFHHKADGKPNDGNDVGCLVESRPGVSVDIWRVQNGDWQADGPDLFAVVSEGEFFVTTIIFTYPNHLGNPEPKEWKEFVTLVIETTIASSF